VLEYVPRIERKEHSRSPLRAVSAGQRPVYLSLHRAEKLVRVGAAEGTAALSEGLAAVFVAAAGEQGELQQVGCIALGMDREQVVAALSCWSGVAPSEQLLSSYAVAVEHLQAQGAAGGDLGFSEEHSRMLMRAVDLRWCAKLAVAGGHARALLQVLQQRYGKALWQLDKQPGKAADQLSTAWYRQAHLKVPLDWVFLRPGVGLIEMALGLAAQQARKGVAVLLQRTALSNVSGVLAAMLERWEGEQRLVCVSSATSPLVWLVVFASTRVERAMVSVRGCVPGTTWVVGSWR
jgi:hypothetical protein